MRRFKKPSPRSSAEKKSTRSIKEEVCRESMASKYLSLVDKNESLTRLMKKFILDPTNKMKSVCQSYYYHSNLVNHNFQALRSEIGTAPPCPAVPRRARLHSPGPGSAISPERGPSAVANRSQEQPQQRVFDAENEVEH